MHLVKLFLKARTEIQTLVTPEMLSRVLVMLNFVSWVGNTEVGDLLLIFKLYKYAIYTLA